MANILSTGAWLSASIEKLSFFARLLCAHAKFKSASELIRAVEHTLLTMDCKGC